MVTLYSKGVTLATLYSKGVTLATLQRSDTGYSV